MASEKICRELRPKIATVNMEIQEIKDEADTEKSPDISALEEDKEKLEEDIGNLDSSMDRLNVDMDDENIIGHTTFFRSIRVIEAPGLNKLFLEHTTKCCMNENHIYRSLLIRK